MAKKIAIANQKGGVGKTTTTYNLATCKAMEGKAVLMIDMDPQYSLTESVGIEPDDEALGGMTTDKLFLTDTDPFDCCFEVESLGRNAELYIVPTGQDLALTLEKLVMDDSGMRIFRKNIEKLDGEFDYIIFDCPPSLDKLLISALMSSDSVIIPVKPERLSVAGLKLIFGTISAVREGVNPELNVDGILVTFYRKQTKEHNVYTEQLGDSYNLLGVIPQSSIVTKEVERGLPVVAAHTSSFAAKSYIDFSSRI